MTTSEEKVQKDGVKRELDENNQMNLLEKYTTTIPTQTWTLAANTHSTLNETTDVLFTALGLPATIDPPPLLIGAVGWPTENPTAFDMYPGVHNVFSEDIGDGDYINLARFYVATFTLTTTKLRITQTVVYSNERDTEQSWHWPTTDLSLTFHLLRETVGE